MFFELLNQTWTTSVAGATTAANTDLSIDGSSRRLVFNQVNGYADVTFTSIDMSAYEELSLQVYVPNTLYNELFTITIGGVVYTFTRDELRTREWNHILFDCSDFTTALTSIRFTSLVTDLVLFVDLIGCRSVTYNCDIDVIEALKDHITLDYGVETTLSAAAVAGDEVISLNYGSITGYITDHSMIELDDEAGTTETVTLIDKEGTLLAPLVNSFPSGAIASVICPVLSEDYDDVQPDPVCGIKVTDVKVNRQRTVTKAKNISLIKEYLGELGLVIYIDCSSKKKLLQMAREYNRNYGKEFQFVLDGEQVEIYRDSSAFIEDVIGNNPRVAYYYNFEPQPYLRMREVVLTSVTVSADSLSPEDI